MPEKQDITLETLPALGEDESLHLYNRKGELLLRSSGKWLHPLFEVETFLKSRNLSGKDLLLHDKIAGRAAAALITRMGFRSCSIDLISRPALDLFRKHNVRCRHGNLVDKIACRTENLINGEMNLQSIYLMIRKRAGYSMGAALTIRNLRSGYNGKEILRGLNLELSGGDHLVVTGDNGTGKSTFLKTLIGVQPLSSGEIILDGRTPAETEGPSLIGYVNQGRPGSSFPTTAQEIVSLGLIGSRLGRDEQKNRIEIAMKRTGCFHLRHRDVNTLSGGENQRVALARCLCQQARLILLDEPTSFLDRDSKEDFLEILNQVIDSTSPTVIMVSHDHQWLEKLGWETRELKDGILC
ncbi:MAG: DUF1893 domain-containing protein [Spirochaetales bacterium]|nr:DUF1893 domain-containing protein [Spirochaetales bacterium]